MAKRYESIIGPKYNSSQLYVRSSDFDRTISSALSNLAGFFPPTDHQIWNENILWQPIPVHSVPAAYDNILGVDISPICPAYKRAYTELMNSAKFQNISKASKALRDYLSQMEGFNVTGIVQDLIVEDTLYVEQINHLKFVLCYMQ